MGRKLTWAIFIFFAIGVGVYPLAYFIFDMSGGLLSSKPGDLLQNQFWKAAFYTHISLGGISLITGWSQFSKKIRARNLKLHRTLGKIYVGAVMISGLCGLYIAFFATGGPTAVAGFGGLAMSWLFTTSSAYRSILKKDIDSHQQWMIRSFALAFAAVTLRIWLPLFQIFAPLTFIQSYIIISWLCWIPNLIFAEMLIRKPWAQLKPQLK